jgi:hypothetical protein
VHAFHPNGSRPYQGSFAHTYTNTFLKEYPLKGAGFFCLFLFVICFSVWGTFLCYLLHFGAKTCTLLNFGAKMRHLHRPSIFPWF